MDKKLKCIYDPLEELIKYFEGKEKTKALKEEKPPGRLLPIDKILINHIVEGNKTNLEKNLSNALKIYSPFEIINEILLRGMKIVGELFSSGRMQLPFVLQSAECMKYAVEFLEQFIDKSKDSICKGVLVLATVKGDVHDIGKNLVDIILTNNGYKVINLGIKCPLEKMIDAYMEHNADAIGMSGLLVKSTLVMKENLEILNKRKLNIPVILGGAALTRKFVETELQNIYNGIVLYANDAFDGLRYMSELQRLKQDLHSDKNKNLVYKQEINSNKKNSFGEKKIINVNKEEIIQQRLKIRYNIPTPPFLGCKIVNNIPVEKIFNFINRKVLFAGRWNLFKRSDMSEEKYKEIIEKIAKPKFEELKGLIVKEKLFEPKVIYGYYPCQSDGEDLIIYKPKKITKDELYSIWIIEKKLSEITPSEMEEWKRIKFTRQKSGSYLCITDYIKPKYTGIMDVLPLMILTVGKNASDYSNKLYSENKYKEYLYFHGLSVEYTEALAEYIHKEIRKELQIEHLDNSIITESFPTHYQGKRYSFGYPACPELENTKILFEILKPERIGIELTDQLQMIPELSINSIILHRKDAKYFSVS